MKTNKMLIILSPGFAADEKDSTCLPAQQQLIRTLQRNFPSLQITLLAFQYPFKKATYYWNGIEVHAFNGRNRGKLSRLLLWRSVWKELKKIRSASQVAGILSFWCGECALIGSRFTKRYHLPHYNWILGQDAKQDNKYVRWIRPAAEELVAMSDFLADEFERNHHMRPAHIIPNAIDPSILDFENKERKIDLLAAGSLIPLKRFEVFIEMVNRLRKEFPEIKAVICGQGPDYESLQALTKKHQLERNIELKEELPHAGLLQLMQCSKILLHPSGYEGFSSVCLEAIFAGAQVVSFSQPMRDPIPHWHIVKNKDEMFQKIKSILNDPGIQFTSVLPYHMDDTAVRLMDLFVDQSFTM